MRYFLFHYTFQTPTRSGDGNMAIQSEGFPANKWLKEQATPDASSVVITGWSEFASEEDYNAFCGIDALKEG